MEMQDLPTLNAALNTASALVVAIGYGCIKTKRAVAHKACMLVGVGLSAGFLTSYVIFHLGGEAQKFEGEGFLRVAYLSMLVTHIVLAVAIVPLVISTVVLGLRDRLPQHRRLARITLPLWLYVSVTGVIIYLTLYGFPGGADRG